MTFVYVTPLMNVNKGTDVQHSFSESIDLVTLQHNDIQLVSFVYGVCHCECELFQSLPVCIPALFWDSHSVNL